MAPTYDHLGCPSVPSIVYHLFGSAERNVLKTFTVPVGQGLGEFAPDGTRVVFSGASLSVLDPLKGAVLERYAQTGETYRKASFTPAGNRAFIPVSPAGILVLDALEPECLPPENGLFNLYSGDGTLDDAKEVVALSAEGGVEFGPGLIGQAFRFNGRDSALHVKVWGACGGCSESWSESLYVKFTSLKGAMTISELPRFIGGPGHTLLKSSTNQIVLEAGDVPKATVSVSTSSPIIAGEWYHLAVVSDKQEKTLYVDGVVAGRIPLSRLAPPPASWPPGTAYVGATHEPAQFLEGLVDELAFYNRKLSPSEIKGLFDLSLRRRCAAAPSRPLGARVQLGEIVH